MNANKIIGGLTLLLIGVILLANTLDILEWSVWSTIFKLWPLLLVSWGISIIFRGKNLSLLGPLIILLGIIIGVVASYMGIGLEGEMVREAKTLSREIAMEVEKIPEVKVPLEAEVTPETESTPQGEISPEVKEKEYSEIEKASIKLKFDLGTLNIGESTPLLYECISHYRYKEFEPFEKYSITGKEADILIYHSPIKGNFRNPKNKWQLKLNNQPIYDLNIETGAVNIDCNLSEFKVEKLYIEGGASNIKLIVPNYNSEIFIDTGASNINIAIPNKVGAMVNIDSGIAVKDLDDFIKKDSSYISHNYNDSEFKTEINIDCGVSHIDIYYTDIP